MRYPDRSSLAKSLLEKVMPSKEENKNKTSFVSMDPNCKCPNDSSNIVSSESVYVLDGGALLHCVFWNGGMYMDIIQQYRSYVQRRYNNCSIIFAGYEE